MINHIYKTLRITAWLLVIVTLFVLLSGFLTTKYFLFSWVDYSTFYYIHTVITPLIFIPLFYFHSLCGILILLCRSKLLNRKSSKIIISILWTSIFILFILLYTAENPIQNATKSQIQNKISNSKALNPPNRLFSLDISEISKHDNPEDCWLIIGGKVYNVTDYLKYHPGKPETIIPYCGKEATEAFQTKNKNKPHSQNAVDLLNSFYIGRVGEKIADQKLQQVKTQAEKPFSDLKKSLLKRFPNAEIITIKPKKEKSYEAKLRYKNRVYKIKLDDQGNILEKHIEN